MGEVQRLVAHSSDASGLHATAPALLLELQTQLGILAATASRATERGRRPFRPTGDWAGRLGELAFSVYLLADQTGVDIDSEVSSVAALHKRFVVVVVFGAAAGADLAPRPSEPRISVSFDTVLDCSIRAFGT